MQTNTVITTKKEAIQITGGLGSPSKMPGKSYGLSAFECKIGSKLRYQKGTTCSHCYALKGRYIFDVVSRAHQRRHEGLNDPRWVDAMIYLIEKECKEEPYFRWHDSGDLQGVWHLEKIVQVCLGTPDVKHWLPTREYGMVQEYLDQGGVIPENLVIRLSAHKVDGKPPKMGLPTSTVSTGLRTDDTHICPAPTQKNACGPCRACWDRDVLNVDYHLH